MIKRTKRSPALVRARRDVALDLIKNTMKAPDPTDDQGPTQDDEEEEPDVEEMMAEMFPFMRQKEKELLEERGILILNGLISKMSLARLTKRMLILHFDEEFTDEIQLILNSPGGYCDAGWAFIDLMRFVKNPIRVVGMGEICSMAASIFMAGDIRILSPNCSTMIHQFSDYGEGSYGDLVAKTKAWQMEMSKDIALLIECSKYKTEAEIKKHILKENDHWLTPKEMKKHGLCDQIWKNKKK